MQVIVAARRFDVTDEVRGVVEARVAKLTRFEPRVSRAEVTLLEEKNRWEVELSVSVDRAGLLHAHGEATDLRTAVDRAVDKLERQLKKSRSRRRDHQGVPREEVVPREEEAPRGETAT